MRSAFFLAVVAVAGTVVVSVGVSVGISISISSGAVVDAQRLASATRRTAATRSGATEEDVGATRVREVAAGIRSEDGREISHVFDGSASKS